MCPLKPRHLSDVRRSAISYHREEKSCCGKKKRREHLALDYSSEFTRKVGPIYVPSGPVSLPASVRVSETNKFGDCA